MLKQQTLKFEIMDPGAKGIIFVSWPRKAGESLIDSYRKLLDT